MHEDHLLLPDSNINWNILTNYNNSPISDARWTIMPVWDCEFWDFQNCVAEDWSFWGY